jgi:hypothetical protein
MSTRNGGVALFPGREARAGDRVAGWQVVEVLEDGVRLRRNGRTYRVPVSGRAREETAPGAGLAFSPGAGQEERSASR